ncbi:MAG: DUF4238 domain-containing protein [Microcystis aeruginosa Ma_SC_T_19800800_S464]|jgi:hypothetical protein|uniref:DUF4238 domain-containing protein n=1 Tax=Microcystis aeruginosa Ma_SC_T_19800800_S464 TaxID=2486257 RepID=A0A552DUX7_MICAE|nr:MAG: DUF4238 domain-containing protein [Microcystis aeruginosa Ma_SC_T_19800800_S464]
MKDRQHFVTQAVLRNFSSCKKKEKIFVILHKNNQLAILPKAINRTFEQNNYFKTNEENYDSWFENIDAQAPSIIASIIENGVENLTTQEREKINEFMAFQWLRCPAVRNESISFSESLKAPQKEYLELKQKIYDLDKQKKIPLHDLKNDPRWSSFEDLDKMLGEDSIKHIHANLFTDIQVLIQKLNDLTLSSVSPKSLDRKDEYVISASPVLYNCWEPEFYFPISPTNYLRFHSIDSSFSPLDSRFLNELQFINGRAYTGCRVAARHQETLEYLKNTPLQDCEIKNLENSFWKYLFLEMYKKNQEAKKVSG